MGGSTVSGDVAAQSTMRSSSDKCKVWSLGPGKPWCQCRLGDGGVQSSPEHKDLGVLVDEKLDMSHQCALASVSWAASPTAGPAGQGRWFCPSTLLSQDLMWNKYCVQLRSPQHSKDMDLLE